MVHVNPEFLDDFLDFTDKCVSQEYMLTNPSTSSDFYTLSDVVKSLPRLRAAEKDLLSGAYTDLDLARKGSSLLIAAKREYNQLARWYSDHPRRSPSRSYHLRASESQVEDTVYPKRLDIYRDTTQATMCNSWRMGQVLILNIIVNVANLLVSSKSCHGAALALLEERYTAEYLIREHIDDFCCSVPYVINPDIKEAGNQYPHGAGSADLPRYLGPEVIAGLSQLKKTLEVGCQARCVPHSQKQWIQQYLTLLSRDRSRDQEKALRLELTPSENALIEHYEATPPFAACSTDEIFEY